MLLAATYAVVRFMVGVESTAPSARGTPPCLLGKCQRSFRAHHSCALWRATVEDTVCKLCATVRVGLSAELERGFRSSGWAPACSTTWDWAPFRPSHRTGRTPHSTTIRWCRFRSRMHPRIFPLCLLELLYSDQVYAFSPNLKLPRSYQWNVALEKSFAGRTSRERYLRRAGGARPTAQVGV